MFTRFFVRIHNTSFYPYLTNVPSKLDCLLLAGFTDPALIANIRLGWKILPRTNTLAYNGTELIMAVKSFAINTTGFVQVDEMSS